MNLHRSWLAVCLVAAAAGAAADPAPQRRQYAPLDRAEGIYALEDGRRVRVEASGDDELHVTIGRHTRTIRATGYGTFASADGNLQLQFPEGLTAGVIKVSSPPGTSPGACAQAGERCMRDGGR